MAIFDFRGEDGREKIGEAYHLAAYTSGVSILGQIEIAGLVFNDPSPEIADLPDGWREVTFEELGIDRSYANTNSLIRVGDEPFFRAEGLKDGDAKILAKVDDNGDIIKLSINFAGANNIPDFTDFNQFSNLTYTDGFSYLFDAVANYATANNLSGEDVLITGYSLGGASTNLTYLKRFDYADGFYENSDYIAFASLVIANEADSNIINIGWENDAIYRGAGNAPENYLNLEEFSNTPNPDLESASSMDNLVLFNDSYALDSFPFGDFTIKNLSGWLAHIDGGVSAIRQFETIANSNFYENMEMDSTVILSNLALLQNVAWVEPVDRGVWDHTGDDSFVLGSSGKDKLGDGTGSDFIDAYEGDDRIRLHEGNDTVHGGEGTDTVELNGSLSEYEIMRTNDGTVYFFDTEGRYGLEELIDIEKVDLGLAQTFNLKENQVNWGMFKAKNYEEIIEGSESADSITGTNDRDRIFGQDGDDMLEGAAGNDLLHGNSGDDILSGGQGNDQLFGGTGNDVLIGGLGDNILSGGLGVDRFVFTSDSGNDVITDFNMGEQGDDLIAFTSDVFTSFEEISASTAQVGSDVIISYNTGSLTIENTQIDDLTTDSFLFV